MILISGALLLCACSDQAATSGLTGGATNTAAAASPSNSASIQDSLDSALPVATLNGKSITRGEWLNVYQSYYNTLVSYYGVDPSSEEGAEILEEYKTAALELLITRQLLTEYAQREGYTNYTQEQRVEAKEYVEEYINSLIEQKKQELSANYTGEEEMDFTEQAKQSVEQAMADAGQTMDSLVEDYLLSLALDQCYADIIAQAEVTEEEIQEYYDALVEEQSKYTSEQFTALYNQTAEGILCYVPEGYVLAQHILIGFEDADQISVMSAYQKLYSLEQDINDKQTELESADNDKKAGLEAELAELKEQLKTAQSEYDAALEKAAGSIEDKANQIYEQVRNADGEAFERIALEQSQDAQDADSLTAYLVGAGDGLITEFHDTALALSRDGEISRPVLGPYGYHIIRRVSALQPGSVPLDNVREEINEALREKNEGELFEQTVQSWREQSGLTIYTENMEYSA